MPRNRYINSCQCNVCMVTMSLTHLAKVEVIVDGKSYFVEAAVMKKLPMSVLPGRDVPELGWIGSSELAGEEVLAAITRAQAKRKREEEESASKKEKDSGITCRSLSPVQVMKDPLEEGMWPPRQRTSWLRKMLTLSKRKLMVQVVTRRGQL